MAHTLTVLSVEYDIRMYAPSNKNDYTQVHYGLDVTHCAFYEDVAQAIGEAFAHALACEGKLDNGEGK